MGVLSKLKSRMKGPSKTDFKKLVGKYDKGSGSGVSAVEAGLRAGQSMYAGVQDYNIADDLAQMGTTIGSSIPGKDKKAQAKTSTQHLKPLRLQLKYQQQSKLKQLLKTL